MLAIEGLYDFTPFLWGRDTVWAPLRTMPPILPTVFFLSECFHLNLLSGRPQGLAQLSKELACVGRELMGRLGDGQGAQVRVRRPQERRGPLAPPGSRWSAVGARVLLPHTLRCNQTPSPPEAVMR